MSSAVSLLLLRDDEVMVTKKFSLKKMKIKNSVLSF